MKTGNLSRDNTIERLSDEEDRLALLEMAKEENNPKFYRHILKLVEDARKYHKYEKSKKTHKSPSVA